MALEELSFQEDESAAEIEQSMWMDEHLQQDTNRGVLNQAMDDITGGRVSPIQSTLNTEWSDISERQRNYYTRKAKEVIDTTLSTLAPGQESELWDSVLRAKKQDSSSYEDRLKKLYGETVLSNLIDAYNQAQTWSTRRQILSLFVHDFTGPELQHMIPGITAWRISEARKHAASSGMGQPVDKKVDIRARLDPVKTDHFVEFMSRPDYIQDVAYGNKKNAPGFRRRADNTWSNQNYDPYTNNQNSIKVTVKEQTSPHSVFRHSITFLMYVLHSHKNLCRD